MTYQGHMNDGSSVQKHSAGGLYPYIIFAKDTSNGLRYGVMCPNSHESGLYEYDLAVELAEKFKVDKVGMH
jgi:hypothetical protein